MTIVTDMSRTATVRKHKAFRDNDQENRRNADVGITTVI